MLMILYKRDDVGVTSYYTLDDRQQNLFNPFCLTISWGRHPEGGRRKQYVFTSLEEKNKMVRRLLGKKLKTYKVLYSFFKEKQEGLRITTEDSGSQSGNSPGLSLRRR